MNTVPRDGSLRRDCAGGGHGAETTSTLRSTTSAGSPSGAWWRDHVAPEFARHIAEQLRPLLPAGLSVEARGAEVWLTRASKQDAGYGTEIVATTSVLIGGVGSEEPLAARAAWAGDRLLEQIQNSVISEIWGGWPMDRTELLVPIGRHVGNRVRLGFHRKGDPSTEPVIGLEPFDIPSEPPTWKRIR